MYLLFCVFSAAKHTTSESEKVMRFAFAKPTPSVTDSFDSGVGASGYAPDMTPVPEHSEHSEQVNGKCFSY